MARKPAAVPEKILGEAPDTAPVHPVTRLDQVVGQAGPRAMLESVMRSGRVHHAWIFHGPQGVGKFSTAVAFGAAILDPTLSANLSGELAPDPESRVQSLVSAGTHPDLHVVTKELAAHSRVSATRDGKQIALATDVVREFLIEPAQRSCVLRSPGSLIGKVFIVDGAELMNAIGQNLLLKTLEEPPEGTVIILVTSSEDRLLATIRSRCQRVGFSPLDESQMAEWMRVAGVSVGPEDARSLLQFAQGSPGAARLALENDLLSWQAAIGPMLDQLWQSRFPPDLPSTMDGLIKARAEAAVKAAPDASKDAANKFWARLMLGYVAEHVRRRLRQDPADPAVASRGLAMIDAIQAAEVYLATNVNLTLVLENLCAQMAAEPTAIVA